MRAQRGQKPKQIDLTFPNHRTTQLSVEERTKVIQALAMLLVNATKTNGEEVLHESE